MDEFVEKFQEFRDWLEEYGKTISVTSEGYGVWLDIDNKFTELGLKDVF